jgi:hypothetical protein
LHGLIVDRVEPEVVSDLIRVVFRVVEELLGVEEEEDQVFGVLGELGALGGGTVFRAGQGGRLDGSPPGGPSTVEHPLDYLSEFAPVFVFFVLVGVGLDRVNDREYFAEISVIDDDIPIVVQEEILKIELVMNLF